MLNMLCPDHQLIIFRQIKERWQEFERMDQRSKLKKVNAAQYEEDLSKWKKKAQKKAYQEQRKKISELNERSLSPKPEHSGQ